MGKPAGESQLEVPGKPCSPELARRRNLGMRSAITFASRAMRSYEQPCRVRRKGHGAQRRISPSGQPGHCQSRLPEDNKGSRLTLGSSSDQSQSICSSFTWPVKCCSQKATQPGQASSSPPHGTTSATDTMRYTASVHGGSILIHF